MKFIINENDIKRHLSGNCKIIIYGMGEYGKRFFDLCEDCGIKIFCFIDNFNTGDYKGVKAIKACTLQQTDSSFIYIICNRLRYQEIYSNLISSYAIEEHIYVFMPPDSVLLELHDINQKITGIDNNVATSTINNRRYQLSAITNIIRRLTPMPLIQFETHLVHHCNLSCKSCDQFSPIADEWFADIKAYKNDMTRMSEIFKGEANRIWLIGGEPLLHPNIIDFMKTARDCFNETDISIFTNGLLLPDMNNSFWEYCYKLNIGLLVTKYPINFDYHEIKKKAVSYGIKFEYTTASDTIVKTSWKNNLDLSGRCDSRISFFRCTQANECISLEEGGNLYTCPTASSIFNFNKYFKKNIQRSEKDYINIYDSDITAEKIFMYLAKPIPMCRYCDVTGRTSGHKWETSNKDINEWV